MMHCVIRSGHDALHLIGRVDAYNLESLRDHTRDMGRAGRISLEIHVGPGDEERLMREAGRWLDDLTRRGVPVMLRHDSNVTAL
jgi:hypothetical protein